MKKILADIEAGKLAPIYVLYGDERVPIRQVIDALRAHVLAPGTEAFNHERFEGRELEGVGRVLEACAQLPMLGSHRLVELSDPDQIGKGRGKEGATKAALDGLAAYAAEPCASTVLVVTGSGVDGRSRLTKAAAKTGVARKFEAIKRDGDASAFLAELARDRGIDVDRDAAHAIVSAVGTKQAALIDALDRASLHAGASQPVTLADVEAVVTHTRETVIFELTDAVGRGDRERALGLLRHLFEESSSSEIGQANMVLAMLIRQVRLIFTASVAGDRVAEAAGVPPFVARKLTSQARRFDEPKLRAAYAGLARLDRDLKGGSAVVVRAPRLALERWILDVCGGVPGTDARA